MQTLKVIIIDDEQDAREILNMMIHDFCSELEVLETCSDGKQGVKAILKHNPDIVFLDIDMPEMNGFQVLDCVKHLKLKTIFVTAHNEHAIRAFKYSAIDYLLKPLAPQDLIDAVNKARQVQFTDSLQQYDMLVSHMRNEDQLPELIALPMADGLQVVNVTDIMYCKADRNYCHIFLNNKKKFLVSKQLKEFENILAPQGFFRVHHSALINLKYVAKYVRGEGGHLIMQDEQVIEVSRQKKEELLKLLHRV